MSNSRLFAPKSYPIRKPSDKGREQGSMINPPRFPEIGGMTTSNADKKEPSMALKKPGGTR